MKPRGTVQRGCPPPPFSRPPGAQQSALSPGVIIKLKQNKTIETKQKLFPPCKVVCGLCLVTSSLTINKTLKCSHRCPSDCSSHSGGGTVALGRVSPFPNLLGSRTPSISPNNLTPSAKTTDAAPDAAYGVTTDKASKPWAYCNS